MYPLMGMSLIPAMVTGQTLRAHSIYTTEDDCCGTLKHLVREKLSNLDHSLTVQVIVETQDTTMTA